MAVYEKIFSRALDRKFLLNFKKILIDNHYKTTEQSEVSVLFLQGVDILS